MREMIDKFFISDAFAVAGVSEKTSKFGSMVYNEFKKKGYIVYPVNKKYENIRGDACFSSVRDLPEHVSSVVAVVPPSATETVIQECMDGNIKNLWIQPGADSQKAIEIAQNSGINTVFGECILMYLEPVKSFHAFHRWINKIFGKYPS